MSVLLDALKQAAQEKKQRDALQADSLLTPVTDESQAPSPTSGDYSLDGKSQILNHRLDIILEPPSDKAHANKTDDELSVPAALIDNDENNLLVTPATAQQPGEIDLAADVQESSEPALTQDRPNNNDTASATEIDTLDMSLDEVVIWDEKITAEDNQPVIEDYEAPIETKIERDSEDEKRKHKEAIVQLNNLRVQAARQQLIKMAAISTVVLLVFAIIWGIYFFFTIDRTQQQLNIEEDFAEYIENVEASIAPVSAGYATENTIKDNTNTAALTPEEKAVDSAIVLATSQTQSHEALSDTLVSVADYSVPAAPLEMPSTSATPSNTRSTEAAIKSTAPAELTPSIEPVIVPISTPATITKPTTPKISPPVVAQNPINTRQYVRSAQPTLTEESILIKQAYTAYQDGRLNEARTLYHRALLLAPKKRDALLGAAAVAVRQNRERDALTYYQQLLTLSPQDRYAQAGLIALQAANISDPKWLTQVNQLLLQYPESGHLYFLKANAHAAAGRWSAAQQSYFDAWSRNQANPDYAYNLAIALDQLGQVQAALDYYLKAQSLSASYPNNIPAASLSARISQLKGDARGR